MGMCIQHQVMQSCSYVNDPVYNYDVSWAIETGAIQTGAIETGAIETGAIETGAIETGAIFCFIMDTTTNILCRS